MPDFLPSVLTCIVLGLLPQDRGETPVPPTLDLPQAMADPAWLGAFPERVRWTADGRLRFDRRVGETEERRTFEIDPDDGTSREISLEERVDEIPAGTWNEDRSLMATTRNDDLLLVDAAGNVEQRTRSTARLSRPRWLSDGRLSIRRDGRVVILDLENGSEIEPIDVRFESPPEDPEDPEGLAADQRRLFGVLADRASRREAANERRDAATDAIEHDVAGPVYLPPGERETGRHLSPDGRWLILEVASERRADAKRDDMAVWVTDDGYVTSRGLRPKVGTRARTAERLVLVDLDNAVAFDIDLDDLPERRTDRLAAIREENDSWRASLEAVPVDEAETNPGVDPEPTVPATPAGALVDRLRALAESGSDDVDPDDEADVAEAIDPRPSSIMRVDWRPDGSLAVAMLRSLDNKDRWIVALDPVAIAASAARGETESSEEAGAGPDDDEGATTPDATVRTIDHLHDPGWINWSFNEMGWMRDGSRLWFLSEGEGWSDLRAWTPEDASTIGLVTGAYEIRDVREHPSDGTLLYRSNRGDPSTWRLERYEPTEGWFESLYPREGLPEGASDGRGVVERYTISPDGERVAFVFSTLDRPGELFTIDLQTLDDGVLPPRRLTDSASEAFRAVAWEPATLVDVPGRHGRDIRGRLHLPPKDARTLADGRRPAVLFVHGAGYLQNGHAGWSRYFREGFFHDLLAREGFVVLDLDYRASSGYGRDWRTAIARDMGPPELDDYEDGIAWLAENHAVDPDRVGIYGGSYGGFATLMGLFTRPGVFKAGAALRPVTDWSFYNDGYTANILNTPGDDPMAYRRSSPIEHAEGLQDHLLICHGMVDDNVPFSDSVRLAQRLIELGKENWEVAIYPVEPHGFRETSSWIDEYRRIHGLFDRVLWKE